MKTKRKKVVVALAVGVIAVGVIAASTVGAIFAGNDGKTEQPVIPAHQHTYEEHPATATCETAGLAAYYSCACGKYFDLDKKEIALADVKEVPATGHTYIEHPATDSATCETAGHRAYLSCDCGKYFDLDKKEVNLDDFLIEPAKGHIYTEHAAVAATCETAGNEAYYTCKNCDKMLDANKKETTGVKVIPALGHTYEQHAAVAATCETTGREAYYTCHCGKSFDTNKNEINDVPATPALGHAMSEVGYQAPNGTTDGVMRHYRCTRNGCGGVFKHNDDTEPTDPADLVIPAALIGAWRAIDAVVTETDKDTGEVISTKTMTMDEAREELEQYYFWGIYVDVYVILRGSESATVTGASEAMMGSYDDNDTYWVRNGDTITVTLPSYKNSTWKGVLVYTIRDDGYLEITRTIVNGGNKFTGVVRLGKID